MSAPARVNTRKAARRALRYASFAELRADVEAIRAAHEAGTLTRTGNWEAGQALWHLALFMRCSIDGFLEHRVPFVLRVLGRRVLRPLAVSGRPLPAGFAVPEQVAWLDPEREGIEDFQAGYAPMVACLDRVDAGERFTQTEPLLGALTHEEWTALHLAHASMHLSFQFPGGVAVANERA